MDRPDPPCTPDSIAAAREAQLRERADFTIATGIPLTDDGRIELPEADEEKA